MQITDEMVDAARASLIESSGKTYYPSNYQMRDALEAALGARRGDASTIINGLADCSITLRQHGLGLAANLAANASACIEEFSESLIDMVETQSAWEDAVSNIISRPPDVFTRCIDEARATLERWGLK